MPSYDILTNDAEKGRHVMDMDSEILGGYALLSEDYSLTTAPVTPSELEQAANLQFPQGWQVQNGYQEELTAVLAPADTTGALGASMVAQMPAISLLLSRGSETLEVQILQTDDDASRAYVQWVMAQGDPVQVPLGRGYAGGATAVIDTGERLIRVSLDDGVDPASFSTKQIQARLQRLPEGNAGLDPRRLVAGVYAHPPLWDLVLVSRKRRPTRARSRSMRPAGGWSAAAATVPAVGHQTAH